MRQRSRYRHRLYALALAFGAAGVVAITASFVTGSSAPTVRRPTAQASAVAPVVVTGPAVTNAPLVTPAPIVTPAPTGGHHLLAGIRDWLAGLLGLGSQAPPPPTPAPTDPPAPPGGDDG